MSLITLVNGDLSAGISPDGQLVSLQRKREEYMHGAGKPDHLRDDRDRKGWDRSELIMFPIVGKPKDNAVSMDDRTYSMDQHGISRAIPFAVDATVSACSAVIRQSHDGGRVLNPKYKTGSSAPENLEWPAYSIEKSIQLLPDRVMVGLTVQNLIESLMKYRLGWHPAFRLQGTNEDAIFKTTGIQTEEQRDIPLVDIIERSKVGAYLLPEVNSVRYVDTATNRGVQLVFRDFRNAMLWTKSADSGMFCIEPVTQLPDQDKSGYLDGVQHESLNGSERKQYCVEIIPF